MSRDKEAAIAIIGAGCWGLSTAYHLERSGFSNITVFDRASEAPSPFSAANDLNKIVRAQYDDDFYTDIGLVSPPTFALGI
jgi:sarcosine oxidase / L-pipecolate oxidase